MPYFTVYFKVILQLTVYINVCTEFINHIIDCNKTTARWTGVYKEGVHDWSIKFLLGSMDLQA